VAQLAPWSAVYVKVINISSEIFEQAHILHLINDAAKLSIRHRGYQMVEFQTLKFD
tara:strand:- start:397 stop:564 length:168 start_codon:yes stop_codon:yes gene_type:complete